MFNYYVYYNSRFIAVYKGIKCCLNYIRRRGLKNDDNNLLYIIDKDGNVYSPIDGKEMEEIDF